MITKNHTPNSCPTKIQVPRKVKCFFKTKNISYNFCNIAPKLDAEF